MQGPLAPDHTPSRATRAAAPPLPRPRDATEAHARLSEALPEGKVPSPLVVEEAMRASSLTAAATRDEWADALRSAGAQFHAECADALVTPQVVVRRDATASALFQAGADGRWRSVQSGELLKKYVLAAARVGPDYRREEILRTELLHLGKDGSVSREPSNGSRALWYGSRCDMPPPPASKQY